MENKYIYRKHLREPAKFFLVIVLIIIISYFITASEIVLSNNHKDKTEAWLFILLVGIFMAVFLSIEFLLIYLIIYRRFKKIYVVLADEEIIYNNARGEIRIPYENIKALKFPSIKYMGGWIKIIHNNGNIRLTVVLQNIGDMVKSLKNKLDEKSISNVYNDKAIYNFIKTAEYSDQSWERVYENLKVFIIAISVNIGAAVIASTFITEILVKIFVLVGALVGTFLTFIISEIIFARKLAKGASKENFSVPDRDKQFELKIYKWVFGIYLMIFVIVLIMIIVKGM